jgi:2-polyprenyl-6-hydroxyphenyl methylase / 3-demethylubiquinone-9 3-methyltransferase
MNQFEQNKTISPREISNFTQMAKDWWDPKGSSRPLHLLNPLRITFIKQEIQNHLRPIMTDFQPFENLNFLDVGCGGGILSEPLCRLGGKVTGIDATESLIEIAQDHALSQNLNIDYHATALEDFNPNDPFDVIIASEILEHVDSLNLFISLLSKLLKPNGLLIISTLNRTPISYLKAIIGAEYLLKLIPKGTHQWSKFIKPSELNQIMQKNNLNISTLQGMTFNPISEKWSFCDTLSINYSASFIKISD